MVTKSQSKVKPAAKPKLIKKASQVNAKPLPKAKPKVAPKSKAKPKAKASTKKPPQVKHAVDGVTPSVVKNTIRNLGGRPPGTLNKKFNEAREAIGMFIDGNANQLQHWLDMVATGVPSIKGDRYIIPPDPVRAFAMFHSVLEFHVPKLARSEITGPNGGPMAFTNLDLKSLSIEELTTVEKILEKAANVSG